jgi:4-oxalmesaconate hydratase
MALFSPRAAGMAHHVGTEATSREWATVCNDLIARVCALAPDRFAAIGQLPQSPGAPPANCIAELKRIVNELGFVGVNLNPDPSGGHWAGPPLTDRSWYPLFEALCELDVPATVHVSSSCNWNFHHTGAHYINADTTAFMQLIQGDLFRDFPALRLIIPHGGGAVPFHWGRYRGMCLAIQRRPLPEHVLGNVFFDTCVYHEPGIRLMTEVVPIDNILFASEMLGAVPGIDPDTGHHFDDTKRYLDQIPALTDQDRFKIFEGNARRVFPRLDQRLRRRGEGTQ